MKRIAMTFALSAILAGTSHAAISGKKPDFMDKEQLTAMRAEAASTTEKSASYSVFFTGRPYLTACAGYIFKYRSYDPGIARWTTHDPSGFPDGANGSRYAPCPTNDFDFQGLLKWSTLKNLNKTKKWSHAGNELISDLWSVETDDGSAEISLRKGTRLVDGGAFPQGVNYTYNCHGHTFGNSEYWIDGQVWEILKGDGYKLIRGEDKTGARVAYWGGNVHSAIVEDVTNGNVSSVTGKKGATERTLTSSPELQGYGDDIKYYE